MKPILIDPAKLTAFLQTLEAEPERVAPEPATPTQPALPEAPEGFHPAIRGPIKGDSTTGDVLFWWESAGRWDDASFVCTDELFALRIGSEVAQLNGLGLKLETGRTYATVSGEIFGIDTKRSHPDGTIAFGNIRFPNPWNSIGQALIDGTPQPLSHPDSIREEIPAKLLPLPKLPDGFKEWRWRGEAWESQKAKYVCFDNEARSLKKWSAGGEGRASGMPSMFYLEAIPADVVEEEPFRIETGKRYVQRNGEVTPPLKDTGHNSYPLKALMPNYGLSSWQINGKWSNSKKEQPFDLIREHVEPEPAPATVARDALWTIRINDGFCSREYRIAGRGDTCIESVSEECAEFLNGVITGSDHVREILPGDPTPEQVRELVEEAERLKDTLIRNGWSPGKLARVLAPFRKEAE